MLSAQDQPPNVVNWDAGTPEYGPSSRPPPPPAAWTPPGWLTALPPVQVAPAPPPRPITPRRRWPWALACTLLCVLLVGSAGFARSAQQRANSNRTAALGWQAQLEAQNVQLRELIATETELNDKVADLAQQLAKAQQDATVSRDATKAITEELAKTRERLLAVEDQLAEAGGARARARDDAALGR